MDGAFILRVFGDLATELSIRLDGDEGLFRAYEAVEFLAPVRAGDFLRVSAELMSVGRTSRHISFVAEKTIVARSDISPSAADVLSEEIVVVRAEGVVVVPLDRQRSQGPSEEQ